MYNYAVLGAGRQGTAAAFDIARWGNAGKIILADYNLQTAKLGAELVNSLIGKEISQPVQIDVTDLPAVERILEQEIDAVLSAVPYYYNLDITKIAIKTKTHMCDLGGHIGIARQQHDLSDTAEQMGVCIVPNCGQVPGMGTTLMVYAMELLDETIDVLMWDGGIPQEPRLPFNYYLTFNIEGLTNEYAEQAIFLRDWKITEVDTMSELESIDFPEPIGTLEAFVAGGGTDTMPWTFEGKVRTLQNKTLRWPGHYDQLKAFYDLGLWELEPISVNGLDIVPREVFHTLFEPKVTFPGDKDMVIVRVEASGKKNGKDAKSLVQIIDRFDEHTGFTAMERTTGWSAAIVAQMMAQGKVPIGAGGVETQVPSKTFVQELRQRDIEVYEEITF
jgi:lysine 6-dehydrogenase